METAKPVEHPFAQYVRILGKGKTGSRSLNFDEARDAMGMILDGAVEDVQLGAFMMLLRVKEESAEELAGFVAAIRARLPAGELPRVDLDWSSYAGKRFQLPWYLLAALALADSGVRILMHGAGGHTAGRVYSEGVLAALGIDAAQSWAQVEQALAESNFAFMPLRQFCPPLQRIIDLRNQFGLRSPVHSLCRLINPCNAPYSIQSVFHPSYADSHQQAAMLLGQANALVFKGEAGEAERRPEADTSLFFVRGNQLTQTKWPRLLEGKQPKLDSLPLEVLIELWRHDQGSGYARAATLGTIATLLQLMDASLSTDACHEKAAAIWTARSRDRV